MNKILISGEIGWDVMPADVRKQLDEAKGKDIEIAVLKSYLASIKKFQISTGVII